MKIAVIHSIYNPHVRGGAEVVVGNIVSGLKKRGHDVFVVSVGYENKVEEVDGIRVYRIKPFNLFNFLDINGQPVWKRLIWHLFDMFNDVQTWQLHKILAEEKPDLALTHSLMGLGFEIPVLLKIMKIRNIHTIHDMQLIHPSGLLGEDDKMPLATQMYSWLCRLLFGSPAAVVFPSQYMKEIYERLGFFNKSKLSVLGNPLPADAKIGIAKSEAGKFTMAFVGQIEPYKGVIDLIKIVNGLAGDWELLIAGDGSAMREATKWSLDNPRVKLLGRLDAGYLEQKIWSKADLLINPSKVQESFGLVVIEAYARGVPVLASSIGALKDLVKENETGWLFKSGDQLDLKRCIEFIMSNQDQLKVMRDNCVKEAEKFRLENYLNSLMGL